MVLVAESPQFVLEKKKTNPQLFFQSSCPHQKVFAEFGKIQLSKHSDMTELLIVYSCLFHRILRRSLTIIFSQREGSSQLVSIKVTPCPTANLEQLLFNFGARRAGV